MPRKPKFNLNQLPCHVRLLVPGERYGQIGYAGFATNWKARLVKIVVANKPLNDLLTVHADYLEKVDDKSLTTMIETGNI